MANKMKIRVRQGEMEALSWRNYHLVKIAYSDYCHPGRCASNLHIYIPNNRKQPLARCNRGGGHGRHVG